MKVLPIASDSMGTRSMATFVETRDVKVLIDPSVALGPRRYGLSPHPTEVERLERDLECIEGFGKRADLVVVTHYHYDHHNPGFPDLMEGKTALLKHPKKKINRSQKERARHFLELIEGRVEGLEYSDGREFQFGQTSIRFSNPVFHGVGSRLGYVTEVSIREGDRAFVFTSDVEGPSLDEQLAFILKENPTILYLDGPLSYMLGYRYSNASLRSSVANMKRIIAETDVEWFIVDHHLLRDLKWKERINEVYPWAEKSGAELGTAAEFLGGENLMLEARRKELYETNHQI